MPNPFNEMNPSNPMNASNMAAARNIYQTLMNASNPMAAFQQYAMRNPKLRPIMDAFKQGHTPQGVFNEMCKQRGIDPDEFIKKLQQR